MLEIEKLPQTKDLLKSTLEMEERVSGSLLGGLLGIEDAKLETKAEAKAADTPKNERKANNPIDATAMPQAGTGEGIQAQSSDGDKIWQSFLGNLKAMEENHAKPTRFVCKIDEDLAYTLDEIDINRRCRTELVNAIVRTFLQTFLPQFRLYRKISYSVFAQYDQA